MQEGDVVTATFTIEVPGVPGTKAATSDDQEMVGDGRAADNLVFAVFDETGAELPDLRQGDWVNPIGDNRDVIKFDNSEQPKVTVTVKLVRGKEYSFVCWAQNEAATCYNFEDMKNIGISYADYNASNNDLRDAFYAYAETDGPVTENFSQTIELERPFAQINVGTTDFVAAQKAGLEIENLYSTMTVKNAATSLETFTGKTSGSQTVTFTYAHAIAPDYDLVINKNKVVNNPNIEIADKYGWLAMNYILVADGTDKGTSSALAEVSFQIREGDATILASYDVPNVPVQRNFRSNIVGGLLTAEGTINVIIDPIFNGEYVINVWDGYTVEEPASNAEATEYYITKASELAWVAQQVNEAGNTFEGVTVYLTSDIDLAGQVWTPIGAGETPFMGTLEATHNVSKLTKAASEYCTIYGLVVDYKAGPAGLVGWLKGGAVKNIVLDQPEVNGKACVAAVVGKVFNSGLVDGCKVIGGEINGNHWVGGIAGHAYATITNNVIDGTSVKGVSIDEDNDGDKVGGLVGLHPADATSEVSGNQVLAVTVAAKRDVAALVGAGNGDNVKNNHVETAAITATVADNAGVVVGRVLAGIVDYDTNTYGFEEGKNKVTINGTEVEPAEYEFVVTPSEENVEVIPTEGGEFVLNVTGNVDWTVTAEGVEVDPQSGKGNGTITVTVPETTVTSTEVEGNVKFTVTVSTEKNAEQTEYTFTIEQTPAEPAFKVVTVAEFLAAAEDKTMYQLTGMITSVTNTSYGNFYLKDETGEVLIYGLCSPEGAQKYWAESGAKVGDTITVQTVRSSYNGAAQGKNAIFVELKPYSQPSEWGIVGDLTNWNNSGIPDVVMYTIYGYENLFVAHNVEIASGAFKIRANNKWNDAKNYGLQAAGKVYADSYYSVITGGGSQNITPMVYGTYDVYFDLANKRVALVTPGKEYADAENGGDPVVVVEGLKDHTWGLIGSFAGSGWNADVAMEVVGDWAVAKNVTLANGNEFKFRADGAWTLSYGSACDVNVGKKYTTYNNGGNMKFVGEAGAYDIYFSLVNAEFYMEKHVEKVETTATLTFDTLDKRTSKTTEQAVWEENGIIVTNDKAKSTTAIADYYNPARFYQNSNLTVAVDGEITSIVFDCNSSSYATELANTLGLKADSDKVTVNLDTPSATYVVENLKKQVRMDAITVTYNK